MFKNTRLGCLILASLLCSVPALAQQPNPQTVPGDGKMYLDVVVTSKSGVPVTDLQQQDFTLLDNKVPRPITSFKIVNGREAPTGIIVMLDAVNTTAANVSDARIQLNKFLLAEGGRLASPVALAVFSEKGIHLIADFSTDGNALSAALQKESIGIRVFVDNAGYDADFDRFKISLGALNQLADSQAFRPGRKVAIIVSPGWPMLNVDGVQFGANQLRELFKEIVTVSTRLAQAHMTIYSIDPLGASEPATRDTIYMDFVKGVTRPNDAKPANLGLEVVATQSGGLVLGHTNDMANLLQECVTDSARYYEISFDPPSSKAPDEYHHLEIQLAKPGLIARTRQGYYAQPVASQPAPKH